VDWLDVARQCRLPIQLPHASPRVAAPDREAFDGLELLKGRLHDVRHHQGWDRRRTMEEQEAAPIDGSEFSCPYTATGMHDRDDANYNDFPNNPRANWSTSVHCSGAGLVALPQPLPSDAVHLSVGWFMLIHAAAISVTTTSPGCPWTDSVTAATQRCCKLFLFQHNICFRPFFPLRLYHE
jgi:hypothetical protein